MEERMMDTIVEIYNHMDDSDKDPLCFYIDYKDFFGGPFSLPIFAEGRRCQWLPEAENQSPPP